MPAKPAPTRPVKRSSTGAGPSAAPPPRRTPWGTISRQAIVDAATAAVRAGRYEEMTIRSLAAELGVAPMSLYRHVKDKDDLLDEVVDRLLRRVWKPRAAEADWTAWVTEASERLRKLLVSQPAALRVYLRHPVASPAAIARMDAMLAVLRAAGLDDDAAHRAFAALHSYTIGFSALEASRDRFSSGRPPNGDGLYAELTSYTTPRQFLEGLGYLLEAIAHRMPARRKRPAARS